MAASLKNIKSHKSVAFFKREQPTKLTDVKRKSRVMSRENTPTPRESSIDVTFDTIKGVMSEVEMTRPFQSFRTDINEINGKDVSINNIPLVVDHIIHYIYITINNPATNIFRIGCCSITDCAQTLSQNTAKVLKGKKVNDISSLKKRDLQSMGISDYDSAIVKHLCESLSTVDFFSSLPLLTTIAHS